MERTVTDLALPAGVRLRRLDTHSDERGSFTEVFRREWDADIDPLQWNVVKSRPGTLRGVHVHVRHVDQLIAAEGRTSIGLRDMRRGAPTEGMVSVVEMDGDEMAALTIPTGVAHGFYFHTEALHVYAVSEYYDLADELGCDWRDPDLGIPWPTEDARVLEREERLQSFADLVAQLEPYQPLPWNGAGRS